MTTPPPPPGDGSTPEGGGGYGAVPPPPSVSGGTPWPSEPEGHASPSDAPGQQTPPAQQGTPRAHQPPALPATAPRNAVSLPAPVASLPPGAWRWIGSVVGTFAGLTVLIGLAIVAIFALSGSGSDLNEVDPRDAGNAVQAFLWLATFGWTGHVGLSAEADGFDGSGGMTGPITFFGVLSLVVLGAAAWWFTRRFPPQSRAQLRLQVGLATLGCFLVLLVTGLLGRLSEDGLTLSSLGFGAVVRLLLLVAVSLLIAAAMAAPAGHRLSAVLGDKLTGHLRPVVGSLAAARDHVVTWTALGLLIGFVGALMARDEVPFGASFTYLTSATPVATVGAHLGSVELSASGDQEILSELPGTVATAAGINLFSEGMPWYLWLLPLLAVLVVLALAVRLTLLRPPGSNVDARQMAVTAAAMGIAWFLVTQVIGSLRLSGSMSGYDEERLRGAMTIGPVWWAFLLLALTGVAVELVHGLAGVRLIQMLPFGLVQRLVPHPHRSWHPYLGIDGPSPPEAPAAAAPDPQTHDPHAAPPTAPLHQQSWDDVTAVRPGASEEPLDDEETRVRPPAAGWSDHSAPGHDQQEHGYADGAWGQPQPAQQWGQRQPMTRRTKLALGGLAGLAALALLGWVLVDQVGQRYYGPKGVALDYASAVVDGEAEEAVKVGRVNIANDDRLLLTDEVYSAAQRRPGSAEVVDVTENEDGETATLVVEFDQDGQRFSETLTARKVGRTRVFFPDWQLEPVTLPTVSLTVMSPVMEVNGHEVDLAKVGSPDNPEVEPMGTDTGEIPGYRINLPALPGSYSFDIPSTTFSEAEPVELTVLPAGDSGQQQYGDGRTLSTTATQAFVDEVTSQVKSKIDACTKDYRASSPCPFDPQYLLDASSDVGNVTISVDEYPTVSTEGLGSPVEGASFPLQLSGTPQVTEKGTYTEDVFFYDEGDPVESSTSVSTSGWSAVIKDGKVTVSWTDPYDF